MVIETRYDERISRKQAKPLGAMALSALGIVFGDIGTSPLYTFKTVLNLSGGRPDMMAIFGSFSLIVWTLIVITSIKYVSVAMRIDNEGEGGILALMSLLGVKHRSRPAIVAVGLFGAALIYGDGAITPAISVLSALEGLNIVTSHLQPFILPACVGILVLLFLVQSRGTAWIGNLFGPFMLLWFLAIGCLGLVGVLSHPYVLLALNPKYALAYLFSGGWGAFLVLGGVFLCVTGAEALYADMGHFGAGPIRMAWTAVVLPALVLSYAGQAAIVAAGAPVSDNVFFRLCPSLLLVPLVILATIATIIASQSIITGAFSMTRQAIHLGWMPRLRVKQTSSLGYGQIYVGAVNWILMAATVGIALGFRSSDNLAAAYGIAVSLTMLMTSFLLFIAMRELWHWTMFKAGIVAGVFLVIDATFFVANSMKIAQGGYVPLALAIIVYGAMTIWHLGSQAVLRRVQQDVVPIGLFLDQLARDNVARVPGTAIFLTRTQKDAPPVMVWHVVHSRSLQEKLLILTLMVESVPWIADEDRLKVDKIGPNVWRAQAHYGFMEHPDILTLLSKAKVLGCEIDLKNPVFYVGRETIVPGEGVKCLPRWVEALFAAMQRNSALLTEYLHLPANQVVEIGREIPI